MKNVAIVAGESSGDLLGSLLVKALQDAGHAIHFYGIAGPRMQALGVRSLFPMETLSVRGYVEALANLRKILAIRRQLRDDLLHSPPALFIGIDAPDFNLTLEQDLRQAGIPTVHFVSPSIWAWRRDRIHLIRKAVSHMLLVFPFEETLYQQEGIPASYVGHPLAAALPETIDHSAARTRLGLPPDRACVALMPGSRDSEVKALSRLYVRTALAMARTKPGSQFLVPLVRPAHRDHFQAMIQVEGASGLDFRLLEGGAHEVMQAADAALIASGTATLEALLLDCPHVITYRVPRLTYWLMKRKSTGLPYVGLPNILAGRFIVPEYIQDQARPDILAGALLDLLDHPERRAAMRSDFAPLRASLRRDTPQAIVAALEPFLQ